MEWQIILALTLTLPVVLFPVAYVWGLTIGGIYGIIKEARAKKAAAEKKAKAIAK